MSLNIYDRTSKTCKEVANKKRNMSIADVIPPSYVHSLFFGIGRLYLVNGAEAESFDFNYPSGHTQGGSATTFEYDATEQSWKLDNNGGGTPNCQMVFWAVDVTDYSSATLVLKKVDGTVYCEEWARQFQIRADASLYFNPRFNQTKYVTYEQQTSTPQTLTLDLSDITGEQYIGISLGRDVDAYVEELYLE